VACCRVIGRKLPASASLKKPKRTEEYKRAEAHHRQASPDSSFKNGADHLTSGKEKKHRQNSHSIQR